MFKSNASTGLLSAVILYYRTCSNEMQQKEDFKAEGLERGGGLSEDKLFANTPYTTQTIP